MAVALARKGGLKLLVQTAPLLDLASFILNQIAIATILSIASLNGFTALFVFAVMAEVVMCLYEFMRFVATMDIVMNEARRKNLDAIHYPLVCDSLFGILLVVFRPLAFKVYTGQHESAVTVGRVQMMSCAFRHLPFLILEILFLRVANGLDLTLFCVVIGLNALLIVKGMLLSLVNENKCSDGTSLAEVKKNNATPMKSFEYFSAGLGSIVLLLNLARLVMFFAGDVNSFLCCSNGSYCAVDTDVSNIATMHDFISDMTCACCDTQSFKTTFQVLSTLGIVFFSLILAKEALKAALFVGKEFRDVSKSTVVTASRLLFFLHVVYNPQSSKAYWKDKRVYSSLLNWFHIMDAIENVAVFALCLVNAMQFWSKGVLEYLDIVLFVLNAVCFLSAATIIVNRMQLDVVDVQHVDRKINILPGYILVTLARTATVIMYIAAFAAVNNAFNGYGCCGSTYDDYEFGYYDQYGDQCYYCGHDSESVIGGLIACLVFLCVWLFTLFMMFVTSLLKDDLTNDCVGCFNSLIIADTPFMILYALLKPRAFIAFWNKRAKGEANANSWVTFIEVICVHFPWILTLFFALNIPFGDYSLKMGTIVLAFATIFISTYGGFELSCIKPAAS